VKFLPKKLTVFSKNGQLGQVVLPKGTNLGVPTIAKWFLGIAKWFLGIAKWFLGIAKWFLGIAKWFLGIAKWFLGIAKRFVGIAKWFLGIAKRFLGIAKRFHKPGDFKWDTGQADRADKACCHPKIRSVHSIRVP
jgi:hypothetical protein